MNRCSQVREINLKNMTITYTLTRKKVKNINLRIKSDGSVWISAPGRVSIRDIDDFLISKQDDIEKAIVYFRERKRDVPAPKRYVSGECFFLTGSRLELKVSENVRESVEAEGSSLYLRVKDDTDYERKKKLIESWYKEQGRRIFKETVDGIYPKLRAYNVPCPQICIRKMTSRWGSCMPGKDKVTFNLMLVAASGECIEYVVLHELVHFIEPNHSKNFWKLVGEFMPDYKERKKELGKYIDILQM